MSLLLANSSKGNSSKILKLLQENVEIKWIEEEDGDPKKNSLFDRKKSFSKLR